MQRHLSDASFARSHSPDRPFRGRRKQGFGMGTHQFLSARSSCNCRTRRCASLARCCGEHHALGDRQVFGRKDRTLPPGRLISNCFAKVAQPERFVWDPALVPEARKVDI